MDQPSWYYKVIYNSPSVNQLKKTILEFCGVKPVKVTYVDNIKTSDVLKREKFLRKINLLGKNQN